MATPPSIRGESRSLFVRAAGGDSAAVAALDDRFLDAVWVFVRLLVGAERCDGSDAAGRVAALCRRAYADPRASLPIGEARVRAWLFQTVAAAFRDGPKPACGATQWRPDGTPLYAALVAPRDAIDPARHREGVERALAGLTPEHREVLGLSRIAGLPHAIVAEVTGRSLASVRRMLGHALTGLGAALSSDQRMSTA